MTSTATAPPSSAERPDASSGPPPQPAPKRIAFSHRVSRWDLKLSPYLYISPFFILFIVVGLFPIAYTAVISFMDWDLVRNSGTFIGFDQYVYVLTQPKFWIALRNTFSIFLLSSVPQLILAIFIAAMLDQNIRAKTFWRMGVLLPYVMAPVAVALIFSNMFGDKYGLVNTTLADLGLPPVMWHSDAFASHIAIATMVNFRWTGYNTLILLAAMQAIPRDYYEAASIDGASKFRQFIGDHGAEPAPDPHLRDHHVDHRRPADLRRAAHVRPVRHRRRRLAVAHDHALPLRHRLGPVELRPGSGARLDPVPHHPRDRRHQPARHSTGGARRGRAQPSAGASSAPRPGRPPHLRRATSSGTLADAPEPEPAPESATDTPEAQR